MAINIEGAIRMDDPRIPKATSLDGVTIVGILNGKAVSIESTLFLTSRIAQLEALIDALEARVLTLETDDSL